MINILKVFLLLALIVSPYSYSDSITDIDWCSVDIPKFSDGDDLNLLDYFDDLSITPIEHKPFTVEWVRSIVPTEADVDKSQSEYVYLNYDASGHLAIVFHTDDIPIYLPRQELEVFTQNLIFKSEYFLNILGIYNDPNYPESAFPLSIDVVKNLIEKKVNSGSDLVIFEIEEVKNQLNEVFNQYYVLVRNPAAVDPPLVKVSDFLSQVNSTEAQLNKYGISLRETGEFLDGDEKDESGDEKGINVFAIYQDPESYTDELLDSLRFKVSSHLNKCIDQIEKGQCPQLRSEDVYAIDGVDPTTKITTEVGFEFTVDEFILSVNSTSLAACALGYALFNMKGDGSDFWDYSFEDGKTWARPKIPFPDLSSFISAIMDAIQNATSALGGAGDFLSPLFLSLTDLYGSFPDIEAQFKQYLDDVSSYFTDLIGLDDDGNGKSFEIPNIFEYKAVKLSPPPPLEITKEYNWVGLDIGDPSSVAANVSARAELRSGENKITDVSKTSHAFAHYAYAGGEATVTVFNKVATLASAASSAYVGIDRVSAEMDAQFFGYNWKDDKLGVDENHPLAHIVVQHDNSNSQHETFVSQVVPVGPIPVLVSAGAYVRNGLLVEYGLTSLKLFARAKPYAEAGLTASAVVDLIIVKGGVKASLTIFDVATPITAHAALLQNEDGEHYIDVDIKADAAFSLLKGKLSAYVKYYVPRAGIPPWKKKKINKVIFKWRGIGAEQTVFSWGATYGSKGIEFRGDPLTLGVNGDDSSFTFEQKVNALIQRRANTYNELNNSINAIASEIDYSQDFASMTASAVQHTQGLSSDLARYEGEFQRVLDDEDPDLRDSDDDGILDVKEKELGTNPSNIDTDGDGIPDNIEILFSWLDPMSPNDMNSDFDGDGYTDVEEYKASSDPNNPNITPENIMSILLIPIISLILQ